jgi:uncharacterized protein YyaL (SSP411 family)
VLEARGPEPAEREEIRRRLLAAREPRVRPGLDDKRLTAWNALMIAALAEAGAVLQRDDYLDAARACVRFVWSELRDADGNLLRTYKDGRAHLNAYLEDHAFLLEALLALYEASFEEEWFELAHALADTLLERFADAERGGFFSTSDDHESLIARRKEIGDHPIPSGNSSAAMGLLRLAALTGERRHEQAAEGVFRLFARPAGQHPEAFAYLLRGIDFHLAAAKQVALVGDDLTDLVAVIRSQYRPHLVLAGGRPEIERPELLANRSMVEGRPTAYVCENFACNRPVTEPNDLADLL